MKIQKNINLAPYTTFRIGGMAKEFAIVKSVEELAEALQYAKGNNLKYYILGGGSNVLFDDSGFDGLVIRIESASYIKIEGEKLECWAGESLASVLNLARDNDLSGLENLAGIPGTIGGAVRGNAGAFGTAMANLVSKVKFLDAASGKIKEIGKDDCGFSYRNSIFKENPDLIIISVVLGLRTGKKEEIEKAMRETIRKRNEKQPQGWFGCAGSFFENPVVEKKELIERFERDTGAKSRENKIPAGWLIRETGLSGKKIGGVELNEKHSNFIINNGEGTAEEVIMLSSIIKQKVRTELGVQLREEVQYVGY